VTAPPRNSGPVTAWEQLVKAKEGGRHQEQTRGTSFRHPAALKPPYRAVSCQVGVKKENVSADDREFSRIPVFQRATALINTRPVRTHYWSGLGPSSRTTSCSRQGLRLSRQACENLGAIWHFPQVKGKTPQHSGHAHAQFHGVGLTASAKNTSGIIAASSVSTTLFQQTPREASIIQKKKGILLWGPQTYKPSPQSHHGADTRFRLGNSRPERIDVIKTG